MRGHLFFLPLLLMVQACASMRDRVAGAERVVVLYSFQDLPQLPPPSCPEGRCQLVELDSFECSRELPRARTVVVTGHSSPPVFIHQTPEALARALRCLSPELVVLDTCYGFSASLLEALAREGLFPLIVGATFQLPPEGLLYGEPFFSPEPVPAAQRAESVKTRSGKRLERWTVDAGALAAARADVATWTPEQLKRHLQRVMPNLVRVPIPYSEALLLEEVAPEQFRSHESSNAPSARPVGP